MGDHVHVGTLAATYNLTDTKDIVEQRASGNSTVVELYATYV